MIKCEACRAFYCLFAWSLINSIKQSTNVRCYLSYDIKSILKSQFWRENVKVANQMERVEKEFIDNVCIISTDFQAPCIMLLSMILIRLWKFW